MKRKYMIGYALAAAFCAGQANAEELTGTLKNVKETGAITIGFRDSSIPFSYLDDSQKPIGYAMDICYKIVDAVKKELKLDKLEVKLNPVTSSTRIPLLANGTIDLECGSTTNSVERQKQVLESGGAVVQETRGWSEAEQRTFSQRSKELAEDYRYFPEPDIPALELDRAWIEDLRRALPELPGVRRERLIAEHALPQSDVTVIGADRELADLFDGAVAEGAQPKQVANWIVGEVAPSGKLPSRGRADACSTWRVVWLRPNRSASVRSRRRRAAPASKRSLSWTTTASALCSGSVTSV